MDTRFLGLAAEDWQAIAFSAGVSAVAVAGSLPFGVVLGWLLARRAFVGKALLETLLNLPLVLPPVVTGYLLLVLLGRRGLLGGFLHDAFGIDIAFTWAAAALAGGVMGFPLLVRAVRVAFQGVDPRFAQAARSLGAGPLDAFLTVSLPLARHGVIAGVVLAFARGLGEFGATLLFAGSQPGRRHARRAAVSAPRAAGSRVRAASVATGDGGGRAVVRRAGRQRISGTPGSAT